MLLKRSPGLKIEFKMVKSVREKLKVFVRVASVEALGSSIESKDEMSAERIGMSVSRARPVHL